MARILLTGATDGIGRQTALLLARAGHALVLHGRSAEKLAAVAALARDSGAAAVDTLQADLARLDDVRAMPARLDGDLDVLLNNAGVYMNERRETVDGMELTWAVNHVAPFLLTHLLLPRLRDGGRIVNVSSIAHSRGRLSRADPSLSRGFDGYTAYAQSKLANVLFTRALAPRLAGRLDVNALHPGVVGTRLLQEGFGMRSGRESLDEGAATSVMLATDPGLAGVTGAYFSVGRRTEPAPHARDPEAAEWLYAWTAEKVGITPLPLPS